LRQVRCRRYGNHAARAHARHGGGRRLYLRDRRDQGARDAGARGEGGVPAAVHDGAGRRAGMIGRLRWLYFLHYAGVGTFLSYFAPYLRGLGFSGEQIGAVTFAQQAVAAPAALIWGGIADRLGAPARALSVCTAGMPFAYLACVGGYALLAQTLPPVEAHPDRPRWRDASVLLRNPRLLFVLAVCAIHWAACAPYHLLFGVLVRDLGLSSSVTGAGLAVGVLAEVFALLAFPSLLRRLSVRILFGVAFAGTAVRWALV